ncbi:hypothetical protein D9M69_655700 [compost metagenome]
MRKARQEVSAWPKLIEQGDEYVDRKSKSGSDGGIGLDAGSMRYTFTGCIVDQFDSGDVDLHLGGFRKRLWCGRGD